jgi:hypothetical protein
LGGLGGYGGAGATGAAGADPLSQPQDLMSKVMEILRKAGLDGPNGSLGVLSLDDIQRLLKSLQQMGPQGIKQVLTQNPGLTQALSRSNALHGTT